MTDALKMTQDLYAAFERGDLPALLDAMHPDIEWSSNSDAETFPWGGTRNGKEGAASFFKALSDNMTFTTFAPRMFFPGNDFCAVLGFSAATFKTNGMPAQSEWMHLFTYSGDKLTMFREYYDTKAVAHAFALAAVK
ncbi:MAG: ketosteroid isomerase-like protein [Hyphomicrobiales bacterium]|jgi:ketosteroid isomerase-like protein|nr:ketosteroid isomerase-like protein [Hyphomicrobiales bacterium]